MKPIKIFVLAILIAIITACSSCENNPFSDCSTDPSFEIDNLFGFYLRDFYTGENLLEIGKNVYQQDTVKVYDENWMLVLNQNLFGGGSLYFPLVNKDADFNIPDLSFHKEFFLYLNQYDTDTLIFDFTMDYDSKCKEQNMTYMKIQYNDSTYFDEPTNRIFDQFFYKK